MTKIQVVASPPKNEPTRTPPTQTSRGKDAEERRPAETDDRWAKMPCTD
jgi:hypothetical protein